jgi:hypothetical protein
MKVKHALKNVRRGKGGPRVAGDSLRSAMPTGLRERSAAVVAGRDHFMRVTSSRPAPLLRGELNTFAGRFTVRAAFTSLFSPNTFLRRLHD